MSGGKMTRAEYVSRNITAQHGEWIAQKRAERAATDLLAALRLAEGLIESGIEAIWGDDEPDPECRHIAGLTVIRAAIASATGEA